jgi:hypothetical protein
MNRVDQDQGRIDYAVTLVGSVRALEGEAEILSFSLTPTAAGDLVLDFTQVILADRLGNVLPVVYQGIALKIGS